MVSVGVRGDRGDDTEDVLDLEPADPAEPREPSSIRSCRHAETRDAPAPPPLPAADEPAKASPPPAFFLPRPDETRRAAEKKEALPFRAAWNRVATLSVSSSESCAASRRSDPSART